MEYSQINLVVFDIVLLIIEGFMDRKIISLIILVLGILILVIGVIFFRGEKAMAPTQQEEDGITEIETVSFTTTEVATHNTKDDCWTIIGGAVYDMTDFIAIHPGGDEILRACGTDGTILFQTRTTEDGETVGSGTPHSSNAISQLGQYYIGDIEN